MVIDHIGGKIIFITETFYLPVDSRHKTMQRILVKEEFDYYVLVLDHFRLQVLVHKLCSTISLNCLAKIY